MPHSIFLARHEALLGEIRRLAYLNPSNPSANANSVAVAEANEASDADGNGFEQPDVDRDAAVAAALQDMYANPHADNVENLRIIIPSGSDDEFETEIARSILLMEVRGVPGQEPRPILLAWGGYVLDSGINSDLVNTSDEAVSNSVHYYDLIDSITL